MNTLDLKWTSFGTSQQAKMPELTVDYTPTNLSNFGVAQRTQEELEAYLNQAVKKYLEGKQ